MLVFLDYGRRHVDDECRVRSIEIDQIIETRRQWLRRLRVVLIEDARGYIGRLVRRLTRREGKEIRDRTLPNENIENDTRHVRRLLPT